MKDDFYRQIVEKSPNGYAYHRIICDEDGIPCDYEFIEVNTAFEKLTGLTGADIIGRRVTEVIPNIREDKFDWVKVYGDIAINGGTRELEQFSEQLNKWYKVDVYSPEKYYFITHFIDISNDVNQVADMEKLVNLSEEFLQIDDQKISYQKIADDFLNMCGAKYVAFNLFDIDGKSFTTVATSGDKRLIKKATEMLGYKIDGKKWEYSTEHAEKIEPQTITRFSSLKSLVGNVIPRPIVALIEKTFDIGEVVLIKIQKSDMMLGDFTIIMAKGKHFINDKVVEVYTRQLGMVIIRKALEAVLSSEKNLLETTLISVGDGVISCDNTGKIILLNRIAEFLTGWTQEEARGNSIKKVFNVVNEITKEKIENIVKEVLESGEIHQLASHTIMISKDGTERPIEASIAPIVQENGEIVGVVLVIRDYTDVKQKQDKIEFLSFHDQLTGLHNRRYYDKELERLSEDKYVPLTLVLADVNGLKLTNDAFGHKAGDALLEKVAEVLKNECRTEDIIARIGGDEFVLLLPETDAKNADRIINRINEAIANEQIDNIVLSISFGHAVKNDASDDMDDIFKQAEDNMYRHKLTDSSRMRMETIDLIVKTLYEKSDAEMFHSKKVSDICVSIATSMNFHTEEVSQIRLAGIMHDIGKIGIDEKILNKLLKLDNHDWNEIERHPEIGYRILSSVNEFSDIAKFVLEHHERYNGRGYPRGIKGEEISLQARIIAIADAYVTMTTDKIYGKALREEEAVEELKRCSGTQFDPAVVKVFIEKVLGSNVV